MLFLSSFLDLSTESEKKFYKRFSSSCSRITLFLHYWIHVLFARYSDTRTHSTHKLHLTSSTINFLYVFKCSSRHSLRNSLKWFFCAIVNHMYVWWKWLMFCICNFIYKNVHYIYIQCTYYNKYFSTLDSYTHRNT